MDADPFDPRTWETANPSLSHLESLRKVYEREAEESRSDASLLRMFRGYRLNQPVRLDTPDLLLDPDIWKRIEGSETATGPLILGIDLGGGMAMSAAAAFFPESGRLEAFATLPANPDLSERGRADAVGNLYRDMADREELHVTPGHAPDVAALVREAVKRYGQPAAVVCDRYRLRELLDALEATGIGTVPIVTRGQGYLDGSMDVRDFRQACMRGDVTPEVSLLLRFAMSGAVTVSDASGNTKIAKAHEGNRRQRHRDDAAAAAVLAVAEGSRRKRAISRPAWRLSGLA